MDCMWHICILARGNHFEVQTDYNAPTYMMTKTKLDACAQQWVSKPAPFDLPGTQNLLTFSADIHWLNKRHFSCHSVSTAVTVTCPKTKMEASLQCPERELKHSLNPVQSWRVASQCTTSRFLVSWREEQRDCQHACCNISLHKASPCIPLFQGVGEKVMAFHSWSIQTRGPIMRVIWLCSCYRCLESKSPAPAYITRRAMGRHNGLIIHLDLPAREKEW